MDKKVVVLRKINGLWRDTGIRYDLDPDRMWRPAASVQKRIAAPGRFAAGAAGSLHRIA